MPVLSGTGNSARIDNRMTIDAVDRALERIAATVPRGWRVSATSAPSTAQGIDAIAKLTAPDGASLWLVFEAKNSIEPRDVANAARQLSAYQEVMGNRKSIPIVVAPFLTRRTRESLQNAGLSYLDLTGNIRLTADRPALFIAATGAEKNPSPDQPARRSLRGAKAGRIVRALCDRRQPWGIRELAQAAETDPGYVSRIVDLLQREDLIKKGGGRAAIGGVDWQSLIRRWADDYSPFEGGRANSYLAPRGLSSVIERLRAADFNYAITASYAASKLAPVTAPRLLTCYVDDLPRSARDLDLRVAEQGINVLLLMPFDRVVYERTWERGGIRFAAASQVAADLLSSSGRGPSEADALLRWMKDDESAWRN
jgi:hypothetical protein